MKPIKLFPLIAAYVTILSTIATAQVPDPALPDDSKATSFVRGGFEPAESIQSSDEFSPLNNEPFFPGGKKALEQHLDKLHLYPDQARLIIAEGTVRVRFRVQASGYLTNIEVVKSRGLLLDSAAVKAVVLMPRWYPAHRSGVAVSSLVELPITFRLD